MKYFRHEIFAIYGIKNRELKDQVSNETMHNMNQRLDLKTQVTIQQSNL